jgi:hypothetical protein
MQIVRVAAAFVIGCSSVLFVGCGDDDSDSGSAGQGGGSGSKASAGAGGSKSTAGVGGKSVAGAGGASGKSAAGSGGAGGDKSDSDAGLESGSAQTPPQGADAIEAWLSKGSYKDWHCEDKVHASRAPSPHGFNRICSNDLIAANATGDGDWPQGAAAVKELYASADASKPIGYAVYLKTDADSAAGIHWYWYERVPLESAAPHDAKGVVADGSGDMGGSKAICVSCHVAAGSDSAHTPTPGGRDEVYTPVP